MAMTDEEGRLRRIDYGDRIFFNSIDGIAGVTYPIGTAAMPSSVIADVITLCVAYNFHDIDVHGILQLLAAMEHYCFLGHCHESITDVLDLNGQDVDDSRFNNCLITGAQGGTLLATYVDCILYNITGFRGMAENCSLYGALALATGDTDYADFDHCSSVHGSITVTVGSPDRVSFKKFAGDMILTAQAAGAVFIRGLSGHLDVDAMVGGTLDIHADAADILINVNCTVGTINIYGNARVVNNTGGTVVNIYTIQAEGGALGLTTFDQETAVGVAANGVTPVVLFDGTGITLPTKICGFMCTMAGAAWAGHPVVWIEDGVGNKIFPFQDNYVEGTDFADGAQVVFNFPVVVPAASGYNVMFRSTVAGDNAGQTLTLDNLDVMEIG